MDFTKVKCISETCKDKDITMNGAGGQFGGRVCIAKLRCPVCESVIMIIPMSKLYEYEIKVTTEQERLEARIQKAKDESELELAKKINRLKETNY